MHAGETYWRPRQSKKLTPPNGADNKVVFLVFVYGLFTEDGFSDFVPRGGIKVTEKVNTSKLTRRFFRSDSDSWTTKIHDGQPAMVKGLLLFVFSIFPTVRTKTR